MTSLLKTATSSPKSLLKDIAFWKSQKCFFLILIAGIIFIYLLLPQTYPPSDDPWIYLSILIHSLAFWGLGAAAVTLSKIQVDQAIAMYVEEKAADELRKIKSAEKDRIDLDRVQTELLPSNPSEDIMMIPLFQRILTEAKERKFESSANIMQPYREESIGDIFKLQNIQKIALHFGILGTFIGLVRALFQIDLESVRMGPLLSSLYVSFGTSVAGLEVAIIIGLLIMLIQRRQKLFFQYMETSTLTMSSLARNAVNKDEFFVEFSQIKNVVTQLSDRVDNQTQELGTQTYEIRQGIKKLTEAKSDFEGFLSQLSKEQIQFIEEMKNVYEIISPKKIGDELRHCLTNSINNISDTFNTNFEGFFCQISQGQTQFVNEIRNAYVALSPKKISDELQQCLTSVVSNISDTFSANLMRDLEKLSGLNASLSLLNEALEKVRCQFIEQSGQLEKEDKKLDQIKSDFYVSLGDFQTNLNNGINISISNTGKELHNSIIQAGNNISKHLKTNLEMTSKSVVTLNRELERYNDLIQKLVSQRRSMRRFFPFFSWK